MHVLEQAREAIEAALSECGVNRIPRYDARPSILTSLLPYQIPRRDAKPGLYYDGERILVVGQLGSSCTRQPEFTAFIRVLIQKSGYTISEESLLCQLIAEQFALAIVRRESFCPAPTMFPIFKDFVEYGRQALVPIVSALFGGLVGGALGTFDTQHILGGALTAELAILINLLSNVATGNGKDYDISVKLDALVAYRKKETNERTSKKEIVGGCEVASHQVFLPSQRRSIEENIIILILMDGTLSVKEIEGRVPSLTTQKIREILKDLEGIGLIAKERRGNAYFWKLTQKISQGINACVSSQTNDKA